MRDEGRGFMTLLFTSCPLDFFLGYFTSRFYGNFNLNSDEESESHRLGVIGHFSSYTRFK